jgi:hypothetical protein
VYGCAYQERSFTFLEKTQLVKVKRKAIRAGVWFRALRRIDRVLIDLTIRVADSVRSASLARCVLFVTGKLDDLFESKLSRMKRAIGIPLARKLGLFAQKWRNRIAEDWAKDKVFVGCLAVMGLNGHPSGSGLNMRRS